MCRKLFILAALVFVLSMVPAGIATAADPSLVAWYKFDGDATDSSGNDSNPRRLGLQWIPSALPHTGIRRSRFQDRYSCMFRLIWAL